MIISPEINIVFVKNHKVAGTSIEVLLSQFCGEKSIITPISDEDEEVRKKEGGVGPINYKIPERRYTLKDWLRRIIKYKEPAPFKNHNKYSKVKKYYPDYYKSFFSFCVERNPWDKAVSMYFWELYYKELSREDLGLKKFLMSERAEIISDWERYADGDTVMVDSVLKFEELEKGMKEVAEETGVREFRKENLPRCKASYRKSEKPYWKIMDPECKERVEEICKKEVNEFGYKFGGGER